MNAARHVQNVLFIMSDQLRWDYLSCYGSSIMHTPNIDQLAARGVRFDAAYVQSASCVPSRMSYYTGRYVTSHGATWNYVPLSIVENTLGDHLRSAGLEATVAGKTHVIPDQLGLRRFNIPVQSELGKYYRVGGFDELDRYDGHARPGVESGYADYLRGKGYDSEDPWTEFVIGASDDDGRFADGWLLRNAHLPARVDKAHSETAYMTDRAIDFIRQKAEAPWVLHLSYIKPHWPLMAPAPYHEMYRGKDIGPIIGAQDTQDVHPVVEAYRNAHEDCLSFGRKEVVEHVRPTYMGLVKELDDHIGRLMTELDSMGRLQDTLIIFCADHGDMLGDHGLGEKELFYEAAVKTPLIVYDPRPGANSTRGAACGHLVESIDVIPTILDALGREIPEHVLEGRSLMPLVHGEVMENWRDAVFAELDYSFRDARRYLKREVDECYAWMVRDHEWKYVHYMGYRPQLFDMRDDPDELVDLGADPAHEQTRHLMKAKLFEWLLTRKRRTTVDHQTVERQTEGWKQVDMKIGVW
ncbi:sulfatase-like hydrolase/transferase [Pusillimonas sp.]|uniref:sulfatase-like hydrolase/transferase n=1 Tax=Pusillimonas sp. TaxID=3040095 RepID=UPI0037C5D1B4